MSDEPRPLQPIPARYLDALEAATYLRMSTTTFDQHAARIPVARTTQTAKAKRIYDINDLDDYMAAIKTTPAIPTTFQQDARERAREILHR